MAARSTAKSTNIFHFILSDYNRYKDSIVLAFGKIAIPSAITKRPQREEQPRARSFGCSCWSWPPQICFPRWWFRWVPDHFSRKWRWHFPRRILWRNNWDRQSCYRNRWCIRILARSGRLEPMHTTAPHCRYLQHTPRKSS